MNKIFNSVAGNHPALNRFDLSYTNITSSRIGILYPVQCDEVYPGDVFKMNAYCHAEVMPLVAPLMSDLNIYAHTFFVPYRLIFGVDSSDGKPIFEKFITGGKDGNYDTPLPTWNPNLVTSYGFSSNLIWDRVGNPVVYTPTEEGGQWTPIIPYGVSVSPAPKYAYNFIYNNYYRDENLVDEVDLDNEYLLNCAFKKDYFTSALEQQQRGISPAIPLSGEIPVSVRVPSTSISYDSDYEFSSTFNDLLSRADAYDGLYAMGHYNIASSSENNTFMDASGYVFNSDEFNVQGAFTTNPVDASGVGSVVNISTVNINNLRLMFAQQRLLELSERAGYRFTEFLQAHFGVSPTDARLDRPEYIGGCIIPINVSINVQSSATNDVTPQGNKVSVANANSIQHIGNYRVLEHGLIMTIISIRPKPIYKQGINKQWLRATRYDYYTPEFAYISEVGILNAELWCDGIEHSDESNDNDIFGYQAPWNELRCKNNIVTGAVREQFDYYTTSREFGTRPHLNEDFITIRDSEFNRIFNVQNEDEFVISWNNIIDAYRPVPAFGVPGKIDHVYGGN